MGRFLYFCGLMEGNENINIQHPEVWELIVAIDGQQVNYILFTPQVANSLISGQVPMPDDSLQSLEDVIYNTPMLLNEYKRVRVIVHSPHFVVLPHATGDDDCLALVRATFPGDEGDAAVCALPENEVKIAHMMPRGLLAFLGRTFNYPVVYHHLFPLCNYFKELSRGKSVSQMFLNLQEDYMDMAIYRDSELQCANTYPFTSAQDAAYFALSAWRAHGLDQLTDELQMAGNGETRSMMTPVLREYVKLVMPAEYPAAAMRLGRNAMQSPLELILLALCE